VSLRVQWLVPAGGWVQKVGADPASHVRRADPANGLQGTNEPQIAQVCTPVAHEVSAPPSLAVCHAAVPGQPAVTGLGAGQARFVDNDGEGRGHGRRGEDDDRRRHRHRRHRPGKGGDDELPPGFQEPPPGTHKPPGHPTGDCTVCHGPNAVP